MTDIHPKVAASGLGGAVATVIVFGLTLAGVAVPATVAVAIGVIASFLCGYLKAA